jgi:TPR repeat protein
MTMTPALRNAHLLLATLALLSGAAHGQSAPARCQYAQVAKVPIRYSGPSLSITMQGVIDGTPAQMLVDTGASETFLTRTGTERRALFLRNTDERRYGIGGETNIYATWLKDFSAGPARSSKGWLRVIGETGFTPEYDAILGASFLLQTDLEFSLATKEISFFRPLNCKNNFLAYWSQDAVVIPFNARSHSGENPHFTVRLNGYELDAVIDSGADTTAVSLAAAKRAGLKMDAPGMVRAGHAVGVGKVRVSNWTTTVDTLAIGDETIRNARISVTDMDSDLDTDILLGADFLRSHRVLFAISQNKLYISYVGGEPLGQRRKLEPWMQQEAEAGNPDAQFALASRYAHGNGVAQDKAQAKVWLDKAAAAGQPQANLQTGQRLLLDGQYAEAARRLRNALDHLPAERVGALWLYLARVLGNEVDLGKQELATTFKRSEGDEWPVPIANYFLDKIDATALLKQAGKDKKYATRRTCQAAGWMEQYHLAKGEKERAQALQDTHRSSCGPAAESADEPDDD